MIQIILDASQFDTLAFPGMGEPLLDETLDEKIIYAKKGFVALILTNGSLLTVDRFKSLVRISVDSIRVSLYGDSTESYDAVHSVRNKSIFLQSKKT